MYLATTPIHIPADEISNGSVAAIGAFDGLHLGHRKLLTRLTGEARRRNLPSVVITFEPEPGDGVGKDDRPPRLMRFREKLDALEDSGIDILVRLPFEQGAAHIRPDTMVGQLLIEALQVRHLLLADDFRMAVDHAAVTTSLQQAAETMDFTVERVSGVTVRDSRVSTEAICDALQRGDMELAGAMLGRYYRISGKVVEGERRGRELGYPTANINLGHRVSPVMGIFAVRVAGLDPQPLDAVASVGTRPTFKGKTPLLEVHIFDFDRDIYGKRILVDFVARLRDELKFDNIDELIEQMDRDSAEARAVLAGC